MTAPSEHEAILRAALHAAADSLEPRGDGLEFIRARVQHARPRAVVWLLAASDALWLRTPAVVQDVFYRLGAGLAAAWDRFAPAPAPGKHRSRTQGLARPLAAMAAVMFIVAAGTYVAINVSTYVSPSSSNSNPRSGQPGPGRHPGVSPSASPIRSELGSGPGIRNSSPTPSCVPAASPAPSVSPSCARSATAQPSPSASVSPSPTPTPTPTDSSSTTDSPSPDPSSS
jgi:hypothetical protein